MQDVFCHFVFTLRDRQGRELADLFEMQKAKRDRWAEDEYVRDEGRAA